MASGSTTGRQTCFLPQATSNFVKTLAQPQARKPHVARHSVFSGPRKHSGKSSNLTLSKSVRGYICLTELPALDKVHLHKNNEQHHCCVPLFFVFIYFTIKLESRPSPPKTLRWGTSLDNLSFFGAPAFVVLKSTSGAMNSVPLDISVCLFQGSPTFLWWCIPSAFRQMSMYPLNFFWQNLNKITKILWIFNRTSRLLELQKVDSGFMSQS